MAGRTNFFPNIFQRSWLLFWLIGRRNRGFMGGRGGWGPLYRNDDRGNYKQADEDECPPHSGHGLLWGKGGSGVKRKGESDEEIFQGISFLTGVI